MSTSAGPTVFNKGRLWLPWHERDLDARQAVRQLLSEFDLQYWDQHERDHQFPEEFFRRFADDGWLGIMIPEEYGGAGAGLGTFTAIMEEVAASGGALDAATSVHTPLLWVPALVKFGTEEQKREYLPRVANGELYVTFGVTEPNAGSDTTRIDTAATREGSGWRISGQKIWNTGALRGDKIMLLARTAPRPDSGRKGSGLTLFLVDLDQSGVDIKAIPKYTRNGVTSCEVFFHDVLVGDDRVIGKVGDGFYHILHSMNGERLILSGVAVGIARWAIETAVAYARDRTVFGRPIGANQGVQLPIAEAYVKLLAASELLNRSVELYEADESDAKLLGALATATKYLTSEVSFFANDQAMQTHGGFAVAREYGVGRYWAESRIQRLAPLANELALAHVASHMLGLPRSF
jgi:acyl-CoA dehydrogenase